MQHETILIVDDDSELLSIVERMLSGCMYVVTSATNGIDALTKIKDQPYNLVLVDIVMKGMNGLDLLDEIKKVSPETVVILMTGYGTENAVDALRKGAIDYILKPFEEQELKIRIKRGLEKQRLGKELKQAAQLNHERLNALVQLNQMSQKSLQEIGDFALEESIKLTGSKTGFIIFLNDDETEATQLVYSKNAMRECEIPAEPKLFKCKDAGLWAEAIRQRRPVIINDYQTSEYYKKSVPDGHLPLKRLIIIPVFENKKIVAISALANKDSDYNDADVHQLTLFMNGMWNVIQRKRAEDVVHESEQKYRTLFDEMVSGFTLNEIICDEQGKPVDYRTLEINEASEKILGIKRENVVGKTFREVAPHETSEWIEMFGKVALTGQPKHYIQYSNTNDKYFEGIAYSPKKGQFAVTFTDVTEQKKAEKALREGENKYHQLIDTLMEGIWIIDKDSLTTFVNPRMADMLGYTVDEMQGKHLFSFMDNEGIEICKYNLEKRRQGIKEQHDFEFIKKDGTRIYTIMGTSPLNDDQGNYNGAMAGITDITERKKAEKMIQQAVKEWEVTFDSMTDIVSIHDRDFKIVKTNKAFADAMGILPGEHENRRCYEIVHGTEQPIMNCPCRKTMESGKPEMEEFWEKHLQKYLLVSVSPIYNDGGEIAGCVHIARDVTARKKKEKELRASEERFSKAFNCSPSMMSIIRMSDRKYTYINDAYTRFSGYTREEAIGKGPSDLNQWVDMREREKILKLHQDGKNPFQNTEMKYFTKTGEQRRALIASEIIEIDGEPCLLSTASDITELRRLEEHLQTRQRMDSLGVLAGGIAHDFNNILAGIMGYIDMLTYDSEGLSDTQKEYIKTALTNCQRAADLIRSFQTFSKGIVAEREAIDIYFPAKEVFTLLKETTDRLIEKSFEIEPDNFYVTAHPVELNQIFLNLGANAIHAIEDRGAKTGDYVKVTAESYSAKVQDKTGIPCGEYVHIIFEDNGIGMSEEVKRKAFDPLFTTRRKGTKKGQGLGLAMVYNIVTNILKGQITIKSTEGKGTTFHIYLPKSQPEKFKEISAPLEIKGGNETILVVDDEETIVNVVETSLQRYGYSLITAADGEQALEVFKSQKDTIGLVILDLTMPLMSGKMAFEQMLIMKPDVKVIISSGQSEEEIREGILTRAKGFTQKPYKLAELAKMVRTVLDEQ